MKIALADRHHKSLKLAQALQAAGHEFVQGPADVLLIDHDAPRPAPYREVVEAWAKRGAKVFIYPHGALPLVSWDGLHPPCPLVSGNFVIAQGHAEVMRRYDYPIPTHVIGWPFCEIAPFRPAPRLRRLLFAPMHPSDTGHLAPGELDLNRRIYEQLLRLPVELTVRHIKTLEQNGLWPVEGVRYVHGLPDNSVADIDAADAVVTCVGTYSSLSIARGRPTVVYGQDIQPNYGVPDEPLIRMRNWDRYADYMRFPFDADDGALADVLAEAARSDERIRDWKRLFIGAPFDGPRFAAMLEQLVDDPAAAAGAGSPPVAQAGARAFSVLAFVSEVVERPSLLAEYAALFGPDEQATLVLRASAALGDAVVEQVQAVIAAAGLDDGSLPDVLLLPASGEQGVAGAAALLSELPAPAGLETLPRFDGASAAGLRALAERHWRAGGLSSE